MGKQLDNLDSVVCFDILNGNKEIEIEECCDGRYREKLNKKEFGELIEELKELYNDMI